MPIGVLGKIVNAHIFCAIEHDTRRVHLLGITINPTDAWIANVLRAATMMDGPLADRRKFILDNDGKYGPQTAAVLGKRLVYTSVRAPNMNAYMERWNRSVQEECLDHVVFLSEAHLRHYVETYIKHYNCGVSKL
jgi:transposase InsO family protein